MASDLWESERQRATLYVERRRRARLALRDAIFRRINAHVQFTEHAHATRRQQENDHQQQEMEIDVGFDGASSDEEQEPEEEALALDFLGDVDEHDMRSLLVEQAATTTTTTPEAPPPAVAIAPISMPTHLLSTASAVSVNTTTLAGVTVGVSLGEDAGVSELMDELEIDVHALSTTSTTTTTTVITSQEVEEHKTEESTPPQHVREQRVMREGERISHKSPSTKPATDGGLQSLWKDVFDPEAAAANEMVSWVTGKNDPEVIKRLETLRGDKKRRITKRFGTDTYVDQATIRRVAKYHAGEGVSSSSSSDESKDDSDFAPQEVVDVDEDEDEDAPSSDPEMLEDDFVDEDEERARKKKPTVRRRIRQRPRTKMTIVKSSATVRTKKPAVRHTRVVHEDSEEDENAPMVEPKRMQVQEEPQAIDLRSDSEIEAEPENNEDASANGDKNDDARDPSRESEKVVNSNLVVKLKVSRDELQKLGESQGEEPPQEDSELPSHALPPPQVPPAEAPTEPQSAKQDTGADDDGGNETKEINDEEGDDSDTGTIDLEQEEMLSQVEGGSKGSPPSVSTGVVNGVLNPVEPQVKMSPQQATPPSSARALEPEPSSQQKSAQMDREIVEIDDVSSDIDLGSGESENFGGDVGEAGTHDHEDAEFGQFFPTGREEFMPSKSKATKPMESGEATPVKKITVENPPSSSSSPLTLANQSSRSTTSKPAPATEKGSNGLRSVPNINTTTIAKGKYKHTRHAIRLLDDNMKVTSTDPSLHDPKEKLIARSRLLSSAPPPSGEVNVRPLLLRRSQSDDSGKVGGDRYLQYENTTPKPRANIKETFATAAKRARERYDKNGRPASTPDASSQQPQKISVTFDAPAVGTGSELLKPNVGSLTSDGVYVTPRDNQLDFYEVTGAVSQYDDDAPLSLSVHKRPTKFVKEIEEAKKKGIDVKKGKPEELNPKSKIPKKPAQQLAHERASASKANDPRGSKRGGDGDNKGHRTSPHKPKRVKTSKNPEANGKPSHYGPSTGSTVLHDGKRGNGSKYESGNGRQSFQGPGSSSFHDSSNRRKDDNKRSGSDRKRARSSSPSSKPRDRGRDREEKRDRSSRRRDDERDDGHSRGRDRERDRERDGRQDRRRDRSRSPDYYHHRRRSLSPPRRGSSHDRQSRSRRSHSRSRSRSPSRSASREERQHRKGDIEQDGRSVPSYAAAEELARSMDENRHSGKKTGDEQEITRQKAGALAFGDDHDGSDIAASDFEFIDGFDDEPGQDIVLNNRYKLDDIKIDHELRSRMVYLYNLSPQDDEEQLTMMFQKYGIAENREIGCPAVDVFICQRSHRPRGDARITFTTPMAAATAVEEQHGSITGSKLVVRAMDSRTMRILCAQFDTFRETWICPNAECHAEVSIWARFCGTCNHHRVFPPSHKRVHEEDWLCSICFATNASHSDKCQCCGVHLPPTAGEKAIESRRSAMRHDRRY